MIHPSAIISKQAEIDSDVEIGPYAVVMGKTRIAKGCKILSHAVLGSEHGVMSVGENNIFYSGAMIGGPPQDLKYKNEPTKLSIGKGNTFREFSTVNIGTPTGGGETRIGDGGLFMAYVHVAHDCHLGDDVVVANTTNFAGHVTVDSHVRIGGACNFNQFVRLGKYSYIAGDSTVNKDVLPFAIAQGNYAVVRAPNKVGLERAGFSKQDIENIHRAIRLLVMGDRTVEEAIKAIEGECGNSDHILHFLEFVKTSSRGIAR